MDCDPSTNVAGPTRFRSHEADPGVLPKRGRGGFSTPRSSFRRSASWRVTESHAQHVPGFLQEPESKDSPEESWGFGVRPRFAAGPLHRVAFVAFGAPTGPGVGLPRPGIRSDLVTHGSRAESRGDLRGFRAGGRQAAQVDDLGSSKRAVRPTTKRGRATEPGPRGKPPTSRVMDHQIKRERSASVPLLNGSLQ